MEGALSASTCLKAFNTSLTDGVRRWDKILPTTPMQDQFKQRSNADGTFDSICSICCRTACDVESLEVLRRRENRHKCPGPPSELEYIMILSSGGEAGHDLM
jgi:hypothetical protein